MTNFKKVSIIALSTLFLVWLAKKARQRQVQKWIDAIEKSQNKALSLEQEEGVLRLYKAFKKWGDGDQNKFAYILATVRHESRFLPVREGFTKSAAALQSYLEKNNYWYASGKNKGYGGRGYVQITLYDNYKKVGNYIGVDLLSNPEKALDMDIAAEIAVRGMMEGWFSSGKPLDHYINSQEVDFLNARRTVNAMDRAILIEGYALDILKNLPKQA